MLSVNNTVVKKNGGGYKPSKDKTSVLFNSNIILNNEHT